MLSISWGNLVQLVGLLGGLGFVARAATAEAKVHDADGNLVALGTGAFRVFEKPGNAIA